MEERSKQKYFDSQEKCPLPSLDNSAFEYKYVRVDLPKDEEGYVVSFDPETQGEEMKEFFDEYGVVVAREVISEEECEKSVSDFWDFLERHNEGLDRNNIATWAAFWPMLGKMGICGNTSILSVQSHRNRVAKRVHKAFANLFATEKLWSNLGRISVMRFVQHLF